MEAIFTELGAWSWIIIGFVLLAGEIVLPGVFLLWIGLAAFLVGVLVLTSQLIGLPIDSVWVQIAIFVALAFVSIFWGRGLTHRADSKSDEPLLNDRLEQMVGKTVVVSTAISNGIGKAKIGDTVWSITGPDMAEGASVRVTGVEGVDLRVEPA